jgi:hypothetical protein
MASRKKAVRAGKGRGTAGRKAGLAITWEGTREAFGNAEEAVGRRVRSIVKQGEARSQQAAEAFTSWRGRLERERRKAMKQLHEQLALLQSRARRERKALARVVDETVKGTLATLNIPSRQEIQELTRRVEELSHKIDGFRRTPAPRRTTRATKSAPVAATVQA